MSNQIQQPTDVVKCEFSGNRANAWDTNGVKRTSEITVGARQKAAKGGYLLGRFKMKNGKFQWRRWEGKEGDTHDQIKKLLDDLKNNPHSRRHIISAWNVPFIDSMALPPCHTIFQFYVLNGKLSCQLYQRSADVFLGVPFNIASYALLTMMVAQVCNLKLGDFIHTFGDAHIYLNHIDQVKLQLERKFFSLPKMEINKEVKDLFTFKYDDFKLLDYKAHPHIKGEVAV